VGAGVAAQLGRTVHTGDCPAAVFPRRGAHRSRISNFEAAPRTKLPLIAPPREPLHIQLRRRQLCGPGQIAGKRRPPTITFQLPVCASLAQNSLRPRSTGNYMSCSPRVLVTKRPGRAACACERCRVGQQIGSGTDRQAEAELFRRMAPRIRLYCLRHMRDEHAAEDTCRAGKVIEIPLTISLAGPSHPTTCGKIYYSLFASCVSTPGSW
jgi:hypothetical protein